MVVDDELVSAPGDPGVDVEEEEEDVVVCFFFPVVVVVVLLVDPGVPLIVEDVVSVEGVDFSMALTIISAGASIQYNNRSAALNFFIISFPFRTRIVALCTVRATSLSRHFSL